MRIKCQTAQGFYGNLRCARDALCSGWNNRMSAEINPSLNYLIDSVQRFPVILVNFQTDFKADSGLCVIFAVKEQILF